MSKEEKQEELLQAMRESLEIEGEEGLIETEEVNLDQIIMQVYEQGLMMGEIGVMKCVQLAVEGGADMDMILRWIEDTMLDDRYQEVLSIYGLMDN